MWTLLQLSMVLVSTMYKTATAQTELDCGETLFTNSSGVISIPRKSRFNLATVTCTYTISIDEPGTILLYFNSWQSTQLSQSFEDCNRENIMVGCVSEGETEPNPNTTRVFCKHERDIHETDDLQLSFADCRTLKLSMRSVNYINRQTIQIPYILIGEQEECSNTSFSASYGRIVPLRLPEPFVMKAVNCVYTIDGGHAKSVVLSLQYVHYESFFYRKSPCMKNWLTFTCLVNGTSMAHPQAGRRICGWLLDFIVRFPDCDIVQINYVNDGAERAVFYLEYSMGDYDEACGNTSFTGPTGVIASPLFPLSYPHKLNCMYTILGGSRNLISLTFLAFNLQEDMEYCYKDWLAISCLSDDSTATFTSRIRRYCGLKTTPLTFTYSNCSTVVLNFVTDSSVSHGGFRLRYIVGETESLCGVRFHDRPSGTIDFSWSYTNYAVNFDCSYIINATEPSSISLTIWSISLQNSTGENCQSDYLQITCIDDQTALNYKVSHRSCEYFNMSTQTTFFNCAAVEIVFHKEATATGKTFLIEYTITGYGDLDGNTQKSGHSVVISVTVILVVVVAVGLAVLWLYRRHQAKNRSEMLLLANEGDTAQLGSENATPEAGTPFAAPSSQDRYTSKYVPLRSVSHHEDSTSSKDSMKFNENVQPGLQDL